MPPTNTCDIIITTGNNTGKKCRDINKYCRHEKTTCDICGEQFGHKSSYLRHVKQAHPPEKKKIVVKPKVSQEYIEMQQELQKLREDYMKVTARVDKVEQEPKNITVVIGDERIFMGLVKRMGDEKMATKFLLENMDHNNSINIVDKMYLEGVEKNRYPIACAGDYKFRYLNHSGDIVDDKGGIKIVNTLEQEIHRALIEANTRLIHQCVDSGDNLMLYSVYDIGTLQEQLGNYHKSDKMKFRDDLAKKVYNKSHPFFQ
jgi:uncharacterized C2H2 Zn-finger protein